MLVIIGWVLALAPIGVFALGYAVAVTTGLAALGGLAHYIVTVSSVGLLIGLAALAVARFAGGVRLPQFLRAVAPAQAVAVSTQSSLASMPAMLRSAEALGVPARRADVTLPLAVALFRVTGPAMNLAVAIYVAHLFGIALAPSALITGVAVAATTTLATVSLPGTISFITSIAPIAVAMGVPVAPLALLVAVETLPDIIRTVGNVTMDVAVTAAVSRATRDGE
jgi:Na+/H+-dicarboxylate symporter